MLCNENATFSNINSKTHTNTACNKHHNKTKTLQSKELFLIFRRIIFNAMFFKQTLLLFFAIKNTHLKFYSTIALLASARCYALYNGAHFLPSSFSAASRLSCNALTSAARYNGCALVPRFFFIAFIS